VLEINPSHPLIKKIAAESKNTSPADMAEWADILMGLASISDGEPVTDGKKFTALLTKILDR